jgi:diguanylate cyclase (GGDEF)-like protein/PAS domain S-box-containing protein
MLKGNNNLGGAVRRNKGARQKDVDKILVRENPLPDKWAGSPASKDAYGDMYLGLFNDSYDAMLITDPKGLILNANPACQDLFQLKGSDFTSLNISDFYVHGKDSARFAKIIKEKGGIRDFEAKLKSPYGKEMDCLFTASARRSPNGDLLGYQGIIRDITAQKNNLARLRENEIRYRTLFEAAHDAILLIRSGVFVDCNSAALKIFAGERSAIIGRTFYSFSPMFQPNGLVSREMAKNKMALALNGKPQFFEWNYLRLDGRTFEAEVSLNRMDILGDPHMLVVVRDISRRKRAMAAKEVSEQRFRNLSESAPDIIYTLDLNGSFTYVNPAWKRLLGHTPQEVYGKFFVEFAPPGEEDTYIHIFKQIRNRRKTISDLDSSLLAKDGTVRHFSLSGSPIYDQAGNVAAVVGIFKDINARRQAERQLEIQKAQLELFIESAPEAIIFLTNSQRIERINPGFTRLFGYEYHEAVGKFVDDLIVPRECMSEALLLGEKVQNGHSFDLELVRRRKDGKRVHVSLIASPIMVRGVQKGLYGIYRDITHRKKAEQALRESEERHRAALEAAPDPVVVYDMQGRVVYLNPAFVSIFGWCLSETIGKKMDFVPSDKASETEVLVEKIVRGETVRGIETVRMTKTGLTVEVRISGAPFFDSKNEPMGCVVTLQDITRRKQAEAQLKYLAFHDTLTGLPNRKAFYHTAQEKQGPRRREGDDATWALLFLDLDRFKDINDSLGHDVGDLLLKKVAARIQESIRQSDQLFRLGGDEFTVIVNNLANTVDAARVAQKICENLAAPFEIKGYRLFLSASVGISVYPHDGRSLDDMMKNADMAMYAAKAEGNGPRFFTAEMNTNAQHRLYLEHSLRGALDRQELTLHYQPLVDDNFEVQGVEALLRWNHPSMGFIPPTSFIPIAEETGVIIPIGDWVLRQACHEVKELSDTIGRSLYVAVNLSPRQFSQHGLIGSVKEALGSSGLSPNLLKLEVTESSVMEDPEEAMAKMELLNQLGVSFSIDDFGTGYSSLSYLRRFPVEVLKIDRSFISESQENSNDREIIKTIIAMAKSLRLKTVAEGVETRAQRDFLCRQGCFLMQGFYFSRPMPFRKLLADWDSLSSQAQKMPKNEKSEPPKISDLPEIVLKRGMGTTQE